MRWKHPVTEMVRSNRHRKDKGLFWVKPQPISLQECFNGVSDLPKLFFAVFENSQVVHITDIASALQHLFNEMVKVVQIDIGEKLAGEVSDRDSSPPLVRLEKIIPLKIIEDLLLRIAVVDNGLHQPERVRAFDFPLYLFKKALMVDRGKIFLNVALQDKLFLL